MSRQSVNTLAQPLSTNAFRDAKRGLSGQTVGQSSQPIGMRPVRGSDSPFGHELGHWIHDRGTAAFACDAETVSGPWDELLNLEARANRYAANLLLPTKMFTPRAARRPMLFQTVRALATTFETSITATAIRLVEHGAFPAMLVCNDKTGRRWFVRGPEVPPGLWPVDIPGRNTIAHDLLNGVEGSSPEDVYRRSVAGADRTPFVQAARRLNQGSARPGPVASLVGRRGPAATVD